VQAFLWLSNDRYWPIAAGQNPNFVHVRTSAFGSGAWLEAVARSVGVSGLFGWKWGKHRAAK
jgi:hypothetical protein